MGTALLGRGAGQSYPLRIPSEIAFVAVDDVARLLEPMELAGINYQLGRHIEAAQGLIHLLGVEQRHVEVVLTAQE